MSLIVTLFVPEGIVLAGDSRLTLNWTTNENAKEQIHSISVSDSNTKIFAINNFGLGTFGAADIKGIPISGFINQFIEEKVKEDTKIDEMPQLLIDFFGAPYGNPNINFYIVGYKIEDGISSQHVYYINIAKSNFSRANLNANGIFYCANWGGEVEVLSRILNTVKLKQGENWIDLTDTPVLWHYMTLQDAIDFSVYAIQTTIQTMRFQQKGKTVGGPIDILVIKPNEKPIWIQKKELTNNN